jgi:type IV secretory pathway VirB4 component
VTENRNAKRFTWYFVDEFHLLLATPQTAEFAVSTWKRLRKFYALPTGITQNVTDFLNNPNAAAVESILSNTPCIRMLEQTHSDAQILSRFLDISDDQMSWVNSPPMGQGLLKCGGTILPFSNKLPKSNVLYPYIPTRPGEVL